MSKGPEEYDEVGCQPYIGDDAKKAEEAATGEEHPNREGDNPDDLEPEDD